MVRSTLRKVRWLNHALSILFCKAKRQYLLTWKVSSSYKLYTSVLNNVQSLICQHYRLQRQSSSAPGLRVAGSISERQGLNFKSYICRAYRVISPSSPNLNTIPWHHIGLLLIHRLRHRPSVNPTSSRVHVSTYYTWRLRIGRICHVVDRFDRWLATSRLLHVGHLTRCLLLLCTNQPVLKLLFFLSNIT